MTTYICESLYGISTKTHFEKPKQELSYLQTLYCKLVSKYLSKYPVPGMYSKL